MAVVQFKIYSYTSELFRHVSVSSTYPCQSVPHTFLNFHSVSVSELFHVMDKCVAETDVLFLVRISTPR